MIFFHVCFCSVSTLNHFCTVGALKHHHFTLLQMLSHSGKNTEEWPAPGCLSTQTFSPFTAAKFLLSLQAFSLTVPCCSPARFYTSSQILIYLNTHLFASQPDLFMFSHTPLDHFSGYFSHSNFFCLHVSGSTFKLPCSAIHALGEP